MDFRPVEISIVSARHLDSVNPFFRPAVKVSVSVTSGSRDRQETPSAKCYKALFRWDFRMRFYIENTKIQQNQAVVLFQVKCKRLFGFQDGVGEVYVPVKHLLDSSAQNEARSFQLITKSGKPRGSLRLSFRFGDVFRGRVMDSGSDNLRINHNKPEDLGITKQPSAPYQEEIW